MKLKMHKILIYNFKTSTLSIFSGKNKFHNKKVDELSS